MYQLSSRKFHVLRLAAHARVKYPRTIVRRPNDWLRVIRCQWRRNSNERILMADRWTCHRNGLSNPGLGLKDDWRKLVFPDIWAQGQSFCSTWCPPERRPTRTGIGSPYKPMERKQLLLEKGCTTSVHFSRFLVVWTLIVAMVDGFMVAPKVKPPSDYWRSCVALLRCAGIETTALTRLDALLPNEIKDMIAGSYIGYGLPS